MPKKIWSSNEDSILKENFHLTNEALAKLLDVDSSTIRARFKALGIERPTGKNALSRARFSIYREEHKGKVPDDWFELPSTRQDAKDIGLSFYWTGTPCERAGHISTRKTSSGGCWECDYGDHVEKLKSDPNFSAKRDESRRERYQTNREEYLEKQRDYKKKPESREWHRRYEANKKKTDLDFRLSKSLRDRLYKAITRDEKNLSAALLVGCSTEELKIYLEKQFTDGMSWNNYGEWHIDHIRPCASFDLSDLSQQIECFHYTNLRPLWAEDNKSKGGTWNGIDPRKRKKVDLYQKFK